MDSRRMRTQVLGICVLLIVLLSSAPNAVAQGTGCYVYAVDFVCGFQSSADGRNGYEPVVKVANYATKLDIYNYGNDSVEVTAQALDTTNSAWTTTTAAAPLGMTTMPPHEATVIDCTTIEAGISGSGTPPYGKPFINGVVTVRSTEPLVVYATKTTEVCGGLMQVDPAAQNDPDLLIFGEDGQVIFPGMPLPPAAPILFGCPGARAFNERYGFPAMLPPGTPGVPPGLRSVNVIPEIGDHMLGADLSISHSIDFERVEGVFVEGD